MKSETHPMVKKLKGRGKFLLDFPKTNIYFNFVQRLTDMRIYYKVCGGTRSVDNVVYERIARPIHSREIPA